MHNTIVASHYNDARDTQPKMYRFEWNQLYRMLTTPTQATNGKTHCSAISFNQFNKPQRSNVNVMCLSALAYDIDNKVPHSKPPVQVDHPFSPEGLEMLDYLGDDAWAFHTTYSHAPEWQKWRLIVPLARPVSPDEYAVLYRAYAEARGIWEHVDQSVHDPARLFFRFEVPDLEIAKSGGNVDGTLVDPDPFVGDVSPEYREPASDFEVYVANQGEGDLEKARSILQVLDPDMGRPQWVRVAHGIHHEMGGSEEGYALFDGWSSGGSKYEGGNDCRRVWDSVHSKHSRPVTMASLVHMAREVDPDWSYHEGSEDGILVDGGEEEDLEPVGFDSLMSRYQVTPQQVADIGEAQFLYKDMVVAGHVVMIVAEPGAGKTTVMEYVCAHMAKLRTVAYVNADISAPELPEALRRAQSGGYQLWAPDFQSEPGLSMASVVTDLKRLVKAGESLADYVFVFDTIKTMTDMIQKKDLKSLLSLFRKMTALGATVIGIGHTNKKVEDGWPVYEGTADLRADVDELVLLMSYEDHDRDENWVSMYGKVEGWPMGKSRAALVAPSWHVDMAPVEGSKVRVRRVSELSTWIDVRELRDRSHQEGEDERAIREIEALLIAHPDGLNWTTLDRLSETGRRTLKRVLNRYKDEKWQYAPGPKNSWVYTIVQSDAARDFAELLG